MGKKRNDFPQTKCALIITHMGCGGSSSGSTSDYRIRGPEFDAHWSWAFFLLFSCLSLSISGASLNRSLVEVQHN